MGAIPLGVLKSSAFCLCVDLGQISFFFCLFHLVRSKGDKLSIFMKFFFKCFDIVAGGLVNS